MKAVLGALAVVALLGAVTAPAQAACWRTQWGWHCSHAYWHHHARYWHHDW